MEAASASLLDVLDDSSPIQAVLAALEKAELFERVEENPTEMGLDAGHSDCVSERQSGVRGIHEDSLQALQRLLDTAAYWRRTKALPAK